MRDMKLKFIDESYTSNMCYFVYKNYKKIGLLSIRNKIINSDFCGTLTYYNPIYPLVNYLLIIN